MQKNRTAVAAGILALALIVGGFALWNNQKATDAPVTAENPMPGDTSTTVSTTPDGTDVTDEPTTTDTTGTTTSTEPKTGETTTTDTKDGNTSSTTIPATHTVKANETLRDIAKQYYGDPIYSADIERVNNIEDANKIMAGSTLKLPKREELNNTTPTTAPATNDTGKAEEKDEPIPAE
jgi:nucleoid-associated protein YgaU